MLEDKLLFWKFKHGDKDALRQIYEKYKDNMRTIACSLLRDTHTAEDVLHDVFVSFAESVEQVEIKTSLKNYLITCLLNRIHDLFRKKESRSVDLDQVCSTSSNSACPDKLLIGSERSQLLADALAAIPFEQREVIMLHLKGGMKLKEIAMLQNTSVSTVQGRYRYGLKKLRAILNREAVR
ncbi:MAG TPA: sigma-70 family RNA polymerase sigma factor [Sedimentisphaerales bacterium]|nr:sigma-70 family RNA polymerase sigma factor [Sedimentisphaerales bacterium]